MSRCELAEVRVGFLLFPGSGVSKLLMQSNGTGGWEGTFIVLFRSKCSRVREVL